MDLDRIYVRPCGASKFRMRMRSKLPISGGKLHVGPTLVSYGLELDMQSMYRARTIPYIATLVHGILR